MRNTITGVRFFTTKQESQQQQKQETAFERHVRLEKQAFAEKCPQYCLSPDFYGAGCLMDDGQTFLLTALNGPMAVLSSMVMSYMTTSIPYPEALDRMIEAEKASLGEVEEKANLLGFDITVQKEEREVVKRVKKGIKQRMEMLNRAKEFYNTDMEPVLKSMNLPEEAFGMGCMLNGKLYEFVSFRAGAPMPYILECLDNYAESQQHYKGVVFQTLKEGMQRYAEMSGALETLAMLEAMNPVENVYEVECPDTEAETESASNGAGTTCMFEQMTLFI